jgi:hypothetical protein
MALSYTSLAGGSSGPASNDFTITTGSSGFTTATLTSSFPAGQYVVTSALSDASYDVYFVNEDGTSSGYTNAAAAQTTITASKSFNKVVIYGTTNNDTFTFAFKYVFSLSENSTSISGAQPQLLSLSKTNMPSINDTIVLTGRNFASNSEVYFMGTDNVARSAKSVTFTNSTSLTATRPDTLPGGNGAYSVYVINPTVAATGPTSSNANRINSYVFVVPLAPTPGTPTKSTSVGHVNVPFTPATVGTTASAAATSYTVTSSPGSITATGSTSPILVTGLTGGTTYTFTIAATNANGTGPSSSASASVVAPQILTDTFNSSGTWTNPGVSAVELLVVAGGGGGGNRISFGGGSIAGGGGAGGVTYVASQAVTGNQSVTIGTGGYAAASGNASSFGSVSAVGGGRAGSRDGGGSNFPAENGGSGGGAGGNSSYFGTGTAGQGNNGGQIASGESGGGGGAGNVGSNGPGNSTGGAGGNGVTYLGLTVGGGGGGGGNYQSGNNGAGGTGGGGTGRQAGGTANTGGGAGSGGSQYEGGPFAGGSGVVRVRYVG